MAQIMQKHNAKLLSETPETESNTKHCNCRNRDNCPVENRCLDESIVYKANLQCPSGREVEYVGITDLAFKTRSNNHTHSFRAAGKKNSTTLSTYIWENNLQPSPKIKWTIVKKCHRYTPGQKNCDLCLSEKVEIVKNLNNPQNLNKRTDIGNKCTQHRNKYTLKFYA